MNSRKTRAPTTLMDSQSITQNAANPGPFNLSMAKVGGLNCIQDKPLNRIPCLPRRQPGQVYSLSHFSMTRRGSMNRPQPLGLSLALGRAGRVSLGTGAALRLGKLGTDSKILGCSKAKAGLPNQASLLVSTTLTVAPSRFTRPCFGLECHRRPCMCCTFRPTAHPTAMGANWPTSSVKHLLRGSVSTALIVIVCRPSPVTKQVRKARDLSG